MSKQTRDSDAPHSFYSSKVYEDLLLCMGASYFTAAFNYDFYISGSIFTVGRYLSLALMLFCWVTMSFTNGLRQRKSFIVGALCWNAGLPIVKILFTSVRALKFSKAGLVIKDIVMILNEYPYYYVEENFNISGLYVSAILAVVCLLLFAAGYYYTKTLPGKTGKAIERN